MVTVVEDFDLDSFGPSGAKRRPQTTREDPSSANTNTNAKRPKNNSQKPQKIRYETKEARKKERLKQRSRRVDKAESAGRKKLRSR
jgi:ribosomal RNA-processing protein 17